MAVNNQKRVVFAPQPGLAESFLSTMNRVVSVELSDDEDVEWIWAPGAQGMAYVSGYTIVKKTA
ncbi:hypothetical protein IQ254_20940 [Nodosilinea sp. LEGE 07088]|uniref:hypothetical protein n=1 Tax=Nodosilinea sp. LEGE 07088 TaxID=2777968 RepID=UPI00187DFB9C|nr:hypothetical protein [Nodosilinea sp. LEGE 07088]MBE9139633.1 hypothetical protein [Nodosilinea sp. LEGE 07088]